MPDHRKYNVFPQRVAEEKLILIRDSEEGKEYDRKDILNLAYDDDGEETKRDGEELIEVVEVVELEDSPVSPSTALKRKLEENFKKEMEKMKEDFKKEMEKMKEDLEATKKERDELKRHIKNLNADEPTCSKYLKLDQRLMKNIDEEGSGNEKIVGGLHDDHQSEIQPSNLQSAPLEQNEPLEQNDNEVSPIDQQGSPQNLNAVNVEVDQAGPAPLIGAAEVIEVAQPQNENNHEDDIARIIQEELGVELSPKDTEE